MASRDELWKAHQTLQAILEAGGGGIPAITQKTTQLREAGLLDSAFEEILRLSLIKAHQNGDRLQVEVFGHIASLMGGGEGGAGDQEGADGPESTEERAMRVGTERLRYLLEAGEMAGMEMRMRELLVKGHIDEAFMKVLKLNISVARQKNWSVKVRVLSRLFDRLQDELSSTAAAAAVAPAPGEVSRHDVGAHLHRPVFSSADVEAVGAGDPAAEAEEVPRQLAEEMGACVTAKQLADLLLGGTLTGSRHRGGNAKKKKRVAKQRWKEAVRLLGESIQRQGWAVCNDFVTRESAAEVRSELERLQPHFKESEIWVGADSGVGAQIVVPSVRGDKVLWMCGGHQDKPGERPLRDPAGQQPAQAGAVEPCEPTVKSSIGVVRFVALRSLLKAVDALVEQIAKQVPALRGLEQRSDCMIGSYAPGARFQNHIDNTTQDGRKLTVLCYLNSDWAEADGGALRLHPGGRAGPATDGTPVVDVFPFAGRLGMFLSDEVRHEVCENTGSRDRLAVTVWYYDRAERLAAIRSATQRPYTTASPSAAAGAETSPAPKSVDDQLQAAEEKVSVSTTDRESAQAFVKDVFGADPGLPIAPRDLRVLAARAEGLSPGAQHVVSGVVGAPSREHFLSAMRRLRPEKLRELRTKFASMGI